MWLSLLLLLIQLDWTDNSEMCATKHKFEKSSLGLWIRCAISTSSNSSIVYIFKGLKGQKISSREVQSCLRVAMQWCTRRTKWSWAVKASHGRWGLKTKRETTWNGDYLLQLGYKSQADAAKDFRTRQVVEIVNQHTINTCTVPEMKKLTLITSAELRARGTTDLPSIKQDILPTKAQAKSTAKGSSKGTILDGPTGSKTNHPQIQNEIRELKRAEMLAEKQKEKRKRQRGRVKARTTMRLSKTVTIQTHFPITRCQGQLQSPPMVEYPQVRAHVSMTTCE